MTAATAFSITVDTHTLDLSLLQAIDAESSTQKHALGTKVRSTDGRAWVYSLQEESGVPAVAGGPAVVAATTVANTVTSDISDGSVTGSGFVGVYMQAATDAYYIWVQTKGKVLAKVSTTSVGKAVSALVDDYFDAGTIGSNEQVGVVLESSTANAYSFPAVMLTDN